MEGAFGIHERRVLPRNRLRVSLEEARCSSATLAAWGRPCCCFALLPVSFGPGCCCAGMSSRAGSASSARSSYALARTEVFGGFGRG
jgi:hypothetical protein